MSPLMKEALDSLLARINKSTGLAHPSDLEAAVEIFKVLVDAGEGADQDEIVHYVEAQGVGFDEALDVQRVYEVLVLAKRPGAPSWKPDILRILRERAATHS